MADALLDTHALLWWFEGNPLMSEAARAFVGEGERTVWVSGATAWEIATKHRLGKLPEAETLVGDFRRRVRGQGFVELPVSVAHGLAAGGLPGPLKDPFDRMLIAQALALGLTLVSNEAAFDGYGAARLW